MAQRETGKLWGSDHPPRLSWRAARTELADRWSPGEHVAIIAPTGGGKSYLALRGILPMRRHVLILDPKGGDDTLDRYGGRRLSRSPTRFDLWRWGDERGGWRFRINPPLDNARRVFAGVIDTGWASSRELKRRSGEGVTYYLDETRVLSDMLDLKKHLQTLWVAGRSRAITIVAATQAVRYTPTELADQSTWVLFGNVRDRRALQRFAEVSGNTDLVMSHVPRLRPFEFLLVGPRTSFRTMMPAPRRG